jgi:hypothetical protein
MMDNPEKMSRFAAMKTKSKIFQEFLLTLAATTVSIILTFGTTAIIDRKKQRTEKREMVMMIMYDMRETLAEFQRADAAMNSFFETQVDVISHPEKMAGSYNNLALGLPMPTYTTTTESIFRSNIETIQTIGNILFVETVSSFYDNRSRYKSEVLDRFMEDAQYALVDIEVLRDLETPNYLFTSGLFLNALSRDFEQCKLMMKVSDKNLEVFDRQQQKLREAAGSNTVEETEKASLRVVRQRNELNQAREAGKKAAAD